MQPEYKKKCTLSGHQTSNENIFPAITGYRLVKVEANNEQGTVKSFSSLIGKEIHPSDNDHTVKSAQ